MAGGAMPPHQLGEDEQPAAISPGDEPLWRVGHDAMTLAELLDRAAAHVRDVKERKVADADGKGPGAGTDLPAVVEGWRGAEHVVTLFSFEDSQLDGGLYAARTAAGGFGCDALTMTVETRFATTPTNPVTGKPWGRDEMQQVALEHDGVARGWVTDALITYAANRAGDLAAAASPYRVTFATNALRITRHQVEWLTEEPQHPDGWRGIIPESLVRFMNEPALDTLMARAGFTPEMFGVEAGEEARAHADCGVVKALTLNGFRGAIMLAADKDSARRRIIDRSLKGLGGQWRHG